MPSPIFQRTNSHPNSVVRPLSLKPFNLDVSSPVRRFTPVVSPQVTSPEIMQIPTPRITSSPMTINRLSVTGSSVPPSSPARSISSVRRPSPNIPTSAVLPSSRRAILESINNPISPTPEEPILINGQRFDPTTLTPIARTVPSRPPSIQEPIIEQIARPPTTHIIQEPQVNAPEVVKPIKKTKKKPRAKVTTWDQLIKNYQIPDYTIMSIEQQRVIRNDFMIRFNLMKQYYPSLGIINLAEDPNISLTEIHMAYAKILDQISTSTNADWYKTMLVLSWLAIEFIITKYLGLKSGGYAYFQSQNMSKYNHLLSQLGEVDRSKGFASWSPMAQLVTGSIINLVIFVVIQTFLESYMSADQRNSLCNTVGSFFTSNETKGPPGVFEGVMGLASGGNPLDNPEAMARAGSSVINNDGIMGMFGNLMGAFGGNRSNNNAATTTTTTNNSATNKPKRRLIED